MSHMPALLMTLLVRDEIDIIQFNIDFHRSMGVEHFIVTDNGSVDGTAELLRSMADEGKIRLIERPEHTHSQGKWVTEMARIAASEYTVDWVIHADADEFFWYEDNTGRPDLREFFAAVPDDVGCLKVRRRDMMVDPSKDYPEHFAHVSILADLRSIARLGPKIVHRPDARVTIGEGNHSVSGYDFGRISEPEDLMIFHYPVRSYEQYRKKIINGATAVKSNADLPQNVAGHWRIAHDRFLSGDLDKHFAGQNVTREVRDARIAEGTMSYDTRMSTYAALVMGIS